MEIVNLHKRKKAKGDVRNVFAPVHPFRMLVTGPSGCGKTNMCCSMIMNNLTFDRVYIYSKHIDDEEDVYGELKTFFDKIERRARKKLKDPEFQMAWYGNEYIDIPDVNVFDPKYQNLILIDDFMNERHQDKIYELFTSGRHKNLSVIYLAQRYNKVNPVIRANCNYFCFFEMANRLESQLIAREQASDLDYDMFIELFRKSTTEKYSFFVIDRKTEHFCLRYRKKWDNLLINCDGQE